MLPWSVYARNGNWTPTLIHVKPWCCQATCHHMNQCWPRFMICVVSACFVFSDWKYISNNHNFLCSGISYTHSLDLTLSNYTIFRWVFIPSLHAQSTEIWKIDHFFWNGVYEHFYWSRKPPTAYIFISSFVWPWIIFHLLWTVHLITSCDMYFNSEYIGRFEVRFWCPLYSLSNAEPADFCSNSSGTGHMNDDEKVGSESTSISAFIPKAKVAYLCWKSIA